MSVEATARNKCVEELWVKKRWFRHCLKELVKKKKKKKKKKHKKKNNLEKIFFGDNNNKHFYKLQKYFLLFLSLNKRKQKYLQKQFSFFLFFYSGFWPEQITDFWRWDKLVWYMNENIINYRRIQIHFRYLQILFIFSYIYLKK